MCSQGIRQRSPRRFWLRHWSLPLVLLFLICTTPPASAGHIWAAPAQPQPAQSAPAPAAPTEDEYAEEEEIAVLEASRQGVRQASEWAARNIDGWFGDLPFEEGGRISRGRLRLRTVWREPDDFDVNLRFRLRMTLPNLENKAHVLIGRENDRDWVRDSPMTVVEQQRLLREHKKDDETFFAGIGLEWLDAIRLSLGLRDLHKPYVKARYTREWQIGERNQLEFNETGFWALDDGFGVTTTLDYEHALSSLLSVRWLNSGTVSEEDEGLDWYSSLGLYRIFAKQRLLSGEILADGETGKDVAVQEYGILVKWRQPVYRDWLLGELSLGHYWEREDAASQREAKWALGMGVQMNF